MHYNLHDSSVGPIVGRVQVRIVARTSGSKEAVRYEQP
jgi:hypothetical protein